MQRFEPETFTSAVSYANHSATKTCYNHGDIKNRSRIASESNQPTKYSASVYSTYTQARLYSVHERAALSVLTLWSQRPLGNQNQPKKINYCIIIFLQIINTLLSKKFKNTPLISRYP